MKKHALVTGGAGFIGTYLIRRLLAEGHSATIIERFTPEKKQLLEDLFGRKVSVVWRDISEESHIANKKIDWIFHLVGIPNDFAADPVLFHTAHVVGTVNMLELARHAGVSKFVYPGSTTCYGRADIFPTPETAPMRLEYPYALTKYIGEQYVLHWGSVYKLPVVVLRPFSVYGARIHRVGSYGSFTKFINQKMDTNSIQIAGNGNQERDYVYISDVVDAFMKAAEANVVNEIFNVGTGKATSINTLVRMLGSRKKYIPGDPKEILYMRADITKIKTILGWSPTVSIQEGVQFVLNSTKTRP